MVELFLFIKALKVDFVQIKSDLILQVLKLVTMDQKEPKPSVY